MQLTNPEYVLPGLSPRLSFFQKTAQSLLFQQLARLRAGSLSIAEGGRAHVFAASLPGPHGQIEVVDPAFYLAVLLGGSVGAAESYIRGEWETPDLVGVIRVMSRNLSTTDQMEQGMARVLAPFLKLAHAFNRNTRSGSRRNIARHYDLSNAFFEQFLDPAKMYSCAVFPEAESTLAEAARHKLDRVCRKLALKPGDRVIEIGSGWGGFAIHAAKYYGCHVTTTTISQAQFRETLKRVKAEGLQHRVAVLCQDYRDLTCQFDKLVSIEMIEAVGHHYLPTFMGKCASLLKEDGQLLIQAITLPDYRYKAALREVDFIKRYIFPGSFIPSVGAILAASAAQSNLRLVHLEEQGTHYARTLRAWHENFMAGYHEGEIGAASETFRRMWRFYLAYCEGAFEERVIGCSQLLFAKPDNRQAEWLQPLGEMPEFEEVADDSE